MKETFTGKKDSVINITLLHPPQKLFIWMLETQPGQPEANPTSPRKCPQALEVSKKASGRKVPPGAKLSPTVQHSSSSSSLSSSPLAAAMGQQQRAEWVLGTPRAKRITPENGITAPLSPPICVTAAITASAGDSPHGTSHRDVGKHGLSHGSSGILSPCPFFCHAWSRIPPGSGDFPSACD